MRLAPRVALLAAAIGIPLGATGMIYALTDETLEPNAPAEVRIGGPTEPGTGPGLFQPSPIQPLTPPPPRPDPAPVEVVVPPASVADGDDDDGNFGDDAGDFDDDDDSGGDDDFDDDDDSGDDDSGDDD